jgi:hypothetical protein
MYIPANRIITNLFTRGDEYKNAKTGIPYQGFYWEMYNGTIFTGKNPKDKPSERLIIIENLDNIEKLESQDEVFQQYADNYDAEVVPNQYQNMGDINTYNNLNRIDISVTKLIPQQYYPQPTEEEYNLGIFTRYFVVKTNEPIYIELNKDTHNKMNMRNPAYSWKLYTLFSIEWTLTGGESEIFNANENEVTLIENKISRKGLRNFLSNNFLQFYIPNRGEVLYSNGDGLVLPDGTAYIGEYHIMQDGTPMTGKTHGKGQQNIILEQLYD